MTTGFAIVRPALDLLDVVYGRIPVAAAATTATARTTATTTTTQPQSVGGWPLLVDVAVAAIVVAVRNPGE